MMKGGIRYSLDFSHVQQTLPGIKFQDIISNGFTDSSIYSHRKLTLELLSLIY
jgi:hypothetical protein